MAGTDYKTVVQCHLQEVSATRRNTVQTVQVSETIDNKYDSGLNVVSGHKGIQSLGSPENVSSNVKNSHENISSNVKSNYSNNGLKNVIGSCENKSDVP